MRTLTLVLHDNMQFVAWAPSPVLTYNKGALHLEESKLSENLSKGNHNLFWGL